MDFKIVEKKTRPVNIAICLPGNNFSGTFVDCLMEFLLRCPSCNINPIPIRREDPVVYYVRNKVLGGSVLRGVNQKPYDGKLPYDYLLWIDSDVIFTMDDALRLLSHGKDIVAGLYKTSDWVTFPTVVNWDVDFFAKNGYFQFLTEKDIEGKKDLIEVAYTGFGFMLIKRGVFESLTYPWFRPLTQKMPGGIEDFSSEDVSFCQLAREAGHKIFVDPTVRVGHEKRKVLR